MKTLRTRLWFALFLFCFAIAAMAQAQACGEERWEAKVLGGGTVLNTAIVSTSVDALRGLARPNGVSGFDAPRVRAERRLYHINAELLAFKLEKDGDIHLVIAQPGLREHTMIAEIPDPKCMVGALSTYINNVSQTRLLFVKAFGIPPVRTFRLAYRTVTITGPLFFDFLHGQDGIAPNGIEIHPVLAIGALPSPGRPSTTVPSAPSSSIKPNVACPSDVVVWVNTRSGVYHLPGTRWYGRTRQGEFICRKQADAEGYRAARNGD